MSPAQPIPGVNAPIAGRPTVVRPAPREVALADMTADNAADPAEAAAWLRTLALELRVVDVRLAEPDHRDPATGLRMNKGKYLDWRRRARAARGHLERQHRQLREWVWRNADERRLAEAGLLGTAAPVDLLGALYGRVRAMLREGRMVDPTPQEQALLDACRVALRKD